jgi:type VI secretion system protein
MRKCTSGHALITFLGQATVVTRVGLSLILKISILCVSISLLLSGCLLRNPAKLVRSQLTIAVSVVPDANANSPIAFDLVTINDKDLAKQVSQMTASEWFQKRDQIRLDFVRKGVVSVQSWEWVPGQVVPDIQISTRKIPKELVVFANYSSSGPHRVKLDPGKPMLITLNRTDISVQPLAK